MALLQLEQRWRPARDVPFLVLAAAVVLSLFRAVDQPGVEISIAGTDIRLVPADFAILLLVAFCAVRLLGRGTLPRPSRAVAYSALAFSAWLLISSAISGFEPFIGAVKLLEYGVLGLGAVLFVQRRAQLWLLAAVLVAVTTAASAYGLLEFFDDGVAARREGSFLGEHDFAALSTMSLLLGIAALFAPGHRLGRLPLVAALAGGVGVVLGAAITGLIGLFFALLAIGAVATARRVLTRRALGLTLVLVALVTAGVLAIRWGDLESVSRATGIQEREDPAGEYASSWSQRLIFAYVGTRMFLDNPIAGVGWYGTIPPAEFARYLDDARARYPRQPPDYFPREDADFIPQQTYDQVLYELGVVGALLFLILGVTTFRSAVAVALQWPRDDHDEAAAYLPLAWVGALAGGLAGAALFGGIPFAALFWITLGVAALAPSLVPVRALAVERAKAQELSAVAP